MSVRVGVAPRSASRAPRGRDGASGCHATLPAAVLFAATAGCRPALPLLRAPLAALLLAADGAPRASPSRSLAAGDQPAVDPRHPLLRARHVAGDQVRQGALRTSRAAPARVAAVPSWLRPDAAPPPPCQPLTVIVGANGCGKTTIIEVRRESWGTRSRLRVSSSRWLPRRYARAPPSARARKKSTRHRAPHPFPPARSA